MSSAAIYEAMGVGNWDSVRALLAIQPSLSGEELEKKHGVLCTQLKDSIHFSHFSSFKCHLSFRSSPNTNSAFFYQI